VLGRGHVNPYCLGEGRTKNNAANSRRHIKYRHWQSIIS